MATDVTNTLIANISSEEDSTSNVPINRSNGNPSFDSTFADFTTYAKLPASPYDLGVNGFGVRCTQFYFKNLDPAIALILTWTPASGSIEQVLTLYPGDQIMFWQKPGGTNAGITQASVSFTGAGPLCEFFIGG